MHFVLEKTPKGRSIFDNYNFPLLLPGRSCERLWRLPTLGRGGRSSAPPLVVAAAGAGGGARARPSKAAGEGGASQRLPFMRRWVVPKAARAVVGAAARIDLRRRTKGGVEEWRS